MSISRVLEAEKPAAKRPRSYMDGPCGRKLSIMGTVLPNTPSQKSKEQILNFFGGYVRQTMSISRALGAEKPATKRPRSYMEGPRSGKTNCKKSKKTYMEGCSRGGGGARAPPASRCPLRVRNSFSISIYLYLLTYPSIEYIYIYMHLSLFEQVKLLERA